MTDTDAPDEPPEPAEPSEQPEPETVELAAAEPLPAEPVVGEPVVAAAPAVRRRRLAVIGLVAALAVLTGLGVVAANAYSNVRNEVDDRDAAERVAGEFADALLTFDYRNLEPTRRRVLALSTGNFKKQYEEAFRQGALEQLLATAQSRSTAEVRDVYTGEVNDETASAIVVVDAKPVTAQGPQATVPTYVQLELVKVGGRWRVDGVTNLNLGAVAGTTSTTVPE